MKCYYEVLNVARDADATEIKNSYRKLALKWHPDKNLSNPDEAKEQFQTVQNAYEVLSDLQERAWYDSHRDQLLRGAGSDFNDDSLDLIPFFTASCYKGFDDDSDGFYSIYREVFKKLIAEEVEYLDDPEDVSHIPEFGKSDTDYEKVNEFYMYWLSFSTSKSYTWLDKYDIREADNRKILKLVEKENNKIRQKARKERNEEIRRLVSFVRKRDKRVIAHAKLLEEKAEENKKKVEDTRRQQHIKRQQELEEEKKRHKDGVYTLDDFHEQLEEIEKHLAAEFGDSEDDYSTLESSDEQNENQVGCDDTEHQLDYESNQNLYCSACNKFFKTIKSFENHEKSKKHKENVMNLKMDVQIALSDEEKIENLDSDADCKSDEIAANFENAQKSTKSKKKRSKILNVVTNNSDSDCDPSELLSAESDSRNRKARRNRVVEKKSPSKASKVVCDDVTSNSVTKPEEKSDNESNALDVENIPINNETTSNSKKSQKLKTKEKKMSQKKKIEIMAEIDVSNIDTSHCCAICKTEFSSKNKLFDHLKKTGHQILLPNSQAAANMNSSSKSKKKKENKQKS